MQRNWLQGAFFVRTRASEHCPSSSHSNTRLDSTAAGRMQVLDDTHTLWNEEKMMVLFNWFSTAPSDGSRKQMEQYVVVGVLCPVELRRQHNTSNGTVKCRDKPTKPIPGKAQHQQGQSLSLMDWDHFIYKSFSFCELSRECHPFAFNYA